MKSGKIKKPLGDLKAGNEFEPSDKPGTTYKIMETNSAGVATCKNLDTNCCKTFKPETEVFPL